VVEALVAVAVGAEEETEVEADHGFAAEIAELLGVAEGTAVGADGAGVGNGVLRGAEVEEGLAHQARLVDRLGEFEGLAIVVESGVEIALLLGDAAEAAVETGGGDTVAAVGGDVERLLVEGGRVAELVGLQGKTGEGREEVDLLAGLTEAAVEIEGAVVALAGARDLPVGGVDLAEEGEETGLEFDVVDAASDGQALGHGAEGVVGLVELPEGLTDAGEPLRFVRDVITAAGDLEGAHEVLEGIDRFAEGGVGETETTEGALFEFAVAEGGGHLVGAGERLGGAARFVEVEVGRTEAEGPDGRGRAVTEAVLQVHQLVLVDGDTVEVAEAATGFDQCVQTAALDGEVTDLASECDAGFELADDVFDLTGTGQGLGEGEDDPGLETKI
jgi:hypothetical protein